MTGWLGLGWRNVIGRETRRRGSIFTLAKHLFFLVYLYSGYVQLRDFIQARLGRSRVVILCYHRVGGRDVLTKPTDEFRRDLDHLKKRYECLGLMEFCERLEAKATFKRRAVVVTFDDGYRDNLTQAFPALRAAGVPATFFVATGFIGTDRVFPHDVELAQATLIGSSYSPKLTWDDLREMEAAGFEIGSHTVNHTNLGHANEQTVRDEVNGALATLNRELGARPRAFSFPWGKPGDLSAAAIKAVREAGHYAAVSAYGGVNGRGSNPFNLHRIDVGNGHFSRLALRARVAGLDAEYFKWRVFR